MSLQKAIEILTDFLNSGKVEPLASCECLEFEEGVETCIGLLSDCLMVDNLPMQYLPSEDTQYKKSLTAWIERKNQERNPYSYFERWQETGVFNLKEAGNIVVRMSSANYQPFDYYLDGVKQICPKITEEGEG